jgi:hypothetical protein
LSGEEIFSVRPHCQVQEANTLRLALRTIRVSAGRKQRESGGAFANENRDAIPHSFVQSFETEHLDVPSRGFFDVADTHCHVVDSFNVNHAKSVALIELSRTLISDNE